MCCVHFTEDNNADKHVCHGSLIFAAISFDLAFVLLYCEIIAYFGLSRLDFIGCCKQEQALFGPVV